MFFIFRKHLRFVRGLKPLKYCKSIRRMRLVGDEFVFGRELDDWRGCRITGFRVWWRYCLYAEWPQALRYD